MHPELQTRVVERSESLIRPPKMKQAAVIALRMRQEGVQAVAQKIGVSRPTLYNWKNQLLGPEVPVSMKRRNESPPSPQQQELELQLESFAVGGDQGGPSLVAVAQDLEETVGAELVDRQIAELVNAQNCGQDVPVHGTLEAAAGFFFMAWRRSKYGFQLAS